MMQAALNRLSGFTAEDITWISMQGSEQLFAAGTVIIREGEKPAALFIMLAGLVGVEIASVGKQQLGQIGPGELLGETSFIENRPASATILALENSQLLVLPHLILTEKLAQDNAFAARFYRTCALIASRRLRERLELLGPQLQEK
ncbi:MAG: cyclic nucleotide-binding domain-containing protein [Chloroflexi bacterium]|nr:cyclic nucleotide-binding domain-containing protein [Chloroflexota bacterium]